MAAATLVFVTALVGAAVAIDQAIAAHRNETSARDSASRAEREAERASAEARRNQVLAERLARKVDEFNQVSAAVRIDRVARAASELGPGWPRHAAAIARWLDEDFAALRAIRDEVVKTVDRLRASAEEVDPAGRIARMEEHADYPRWRQIEHRQTSLLTSG